MNLKKTLTYDIQANRYSLTNGEEHGEPSAHIIVEFPPVVDGLPAFRTALEEVFAEILEACKRKMEEGKVNG